MPILKKIVEQHFTTFLESEKQYTNMPDQESTWTKSTEMKKKNRSKPTTSTPQLTIKPSPKSSNFIISFVDDSLKLVNNFMNNLTSSTKKHESKLKATEVIDNINKKIAAINTWFKKNSISKDKQTYYYDGQKLVLKTLHESVETRIKILNKEWFEMRKKLRNSIKNQNNIKLDVLQKDFLRLKNVLSHFKVAFEDDFLLSSDRDHSQQVTEEKDLIVKDIDELVKFREKINTIVETMVGKIKFQISANSNDYLVSTSNYKLLISTITSEGGE